MTKLRPFQWEGVLQIRKFKGRALLADEQGLGKTIQALKWIIKADKFPAVIVTPASLKWTWHAEASAHFGLRTEVLEGRPKGRQLFSDRVVILNYDILREWLPMLIKLQPRCVILDEVHFLKNIGAARTKAAIKLSRKARSVIGLSGTPLTNRPIELWSILQCIKPKLFPSRTQFAWRYCKPKHTPWGWKFDGSSHREELRGILLKSCMIRRLKRDVLPELPAKERKAVSFKLRDRAEYDRAERDFIAWLRSVSPSRARRARKAMAMVKVGYLIRLAARLKLAQTTQWIRDFFEASPGKKLVCFTMHTFVIDHLRAQFAKRCVVIDGRVTGRMREAAKNKFQNSPRTDLLLGNWKAAGVGLTLTAARDAVALDLPWTPGDLVQGEDRVHRIGQKGRVFVHYLAALGTIEEKQLRILQRKSKILDAILDGGRSVRDLDVFNELLSRYSR